jgi:hypothetical protein
MRVMMGALALLAGVLSGCGGELVGGGQRDVETAATAGGGPSPQLTPAYDVAPAGAEPRAQVTSLEGTVTVSGRTSLVRGGAPAAAGAGTAAVRADGRDTARVSRGRVPRGPYDAVRIAFTAVSAEVSGGVGTGGTVLSGRFEVAIPPGDSVVVEVPAAIGAAAGTVRVLVRLDAATWLAAADPVTRTVPAAAFRAAVRISVW